MTPTHAGSRAIGMDGGVGDVNWNHVWAALQEIAAEMVEVEKLDDMPEWACRLSDAIADAQDPLVELCREQEAAALSTTQPGSAGA